MFYMYLENILLCSTVVILIAQAMWSSVYLVNVLMLLSLVLLSTADLSVSNSRLEGCMKLLLEKEEHEKSDDTHLLKILALL